MEETVKQVADYLQSSPILNIVIAFIAGFAACKTVAYERRSGWFASLLVGFVGFFFAEFVIFYFRFVEYFDQLAGFRVLFDFIAAYIGAFVIAAIVHFFKPV